MKSSRSQVDDALFVLLQGAYRWASSYKNFRNWGKWDPTNQPTLFLRRPAESNQRAQGYGLQKYHLMYHVWIYFRTDADKVLDTDPYDATINPIVDAIDSALHPAPGWQQNLGGLVNEVWITDVLVDDGLADGQGVIMMTLVVECGS